MNPTAETLGAKRVWSPRLLALLVLSCLMLAAGLSVFSARAYAAFVPVPTAQGAHLTLKSDPFPVNFRDMSPGSVEHWQIDSALVDPSSTLTVQFARSGELVTHPRGLHVQLDRCNQAWTNVTTTPSCGSGEANVFGPAAASAIPDSTIYDLAGLTHAQDKYLLVTLSIPDSPEAEADTSLMGITATVGFGLTATGDDPTDPGSPSDPGTPSNPGGGLAFTGVDIGGLTLFALGALGLGIVLMASRNARLAHAGKASK